MSANFMNGEQGDDGLLGPFGDRFAKTRKRERRRTDPMEVRTAEEAEAVDIPKPEDQKKRLAGFVGALCKDTLEQAKRQMEQIWAENKEISRLQSMANSSHKQAKRRERTANKQLQKAERRLEKNPELVEKRVGKPEFGSYLGAAFLTQLVLLVWCAGIEVFNLTSWIAAAGLQSDRVSAAVMALGVTGTAMFLIRCLICGPTGPRHRALLKVLRWSGAVLGVVGMLLFVASIGVAASGADEAGKPAEGLIPKHFLPLISFCLLLPTTAQLERMVELAYPKLFVHKLAPNPEHAPAKSSYEAAFAQWSKWKKRLTAAKSLRRRLKSAKAVWILDQLKQLLQLLSDAAWRAKDEELQESVRDGQRALRELQRQQRERQQKLSSHQSRRPGPVDDIPF